MAQVPVVVSFHRAPRFPPPVDTDQLAPIPIVVYGDWPPRAADVAGFTSLTCSRSVFDPALLLPSVARWNAP